MRESRNQVFTVSADVAVKTTKNYSRAIKTKRPKWPFHSGSIDNKNTTLWIHSENLFVFFKVNSSTATPNYFGETVEQSAALPLLPSYQLTPSKNRLLSRLPSPQKKYYCSYLIFLLQDLCLALFTLLKEVVGGGGGQPSSFPSCCVHLCLLSSAAHNNHSGFLAHDVTFH